MLEALLDEGHRVGLVVTLPDRPNPRGHDPIPTPVRKLAEERRLRIAIAEKLKSPELAEKARACNADIGVVVAFKILPPDLYNAPKMGTVNVHPSLLPKLRGPAPIRWAIIRGHEKTGITTFFINDKVDTGDILLQEKIDIDSEEDYGDLCNRVFQKSKQALLKTLDLLEKGQLEPMNQAHSEASSAPKIKKETCKIDWSVDNAKVHNLVRAMSPTPGAWTVFEEETIKVLKTRMSLDKGDPGEIIECSPGNTLKVACGNGSIEILKLQRSGKKAMDFTSFLCGCNLEKGQKFK